MLNRIIFFIIMISFMIMPCHAMENAKLTVTLKWQTNSGETGAKTYDTVKLSSFHGKGLWVAFLKNGEKYYPGISIRGKFQPAGVPLRDISSLKLEAGITNGSVETLKETSTLFSKDRPVGSKTASPENVYHLLVLNDFTDSSALPAVLGENESPVSQWKESFFRTHRLGMNYAVQSDEKARKIADVLEVKTNYRLPRLIMVAEELLVLNVESVAQKKKKSSGGMFGFNLAEKMDGDDKKEEKKTEIKKIPTYSIDVMHDEIEAEGKYRAGFQNARSLWNDILEGKVIYEASEGKRRVITATIVFSQMQKNISLGRSKNKVLLISAGNTKNLDQCEKLWPTVKDDIMGFLKGHPDWNVLIPQKPVKFYENNKTIYGLYAWYKVHPASGRMVGVLSNSMRGGTSAISDEWNKIEEKIAEKAKEAAKKKGITGIQAFGQQIAGMYVAAGGIIEGITITFCNPKIAALSEKEWLKFLSSHSLKYCSKFLEDNAHLYDDYATQLSFWQGAITMASLLGGKDAVEDGARRAFDGAADKARKDAKKWADEQYDNLKNKSMEEIDNIANKAAENFGKEVKEWADAIDKTREITGKVEETAKKGKEVYNRTSAVKEEIKRKLASQ